VNRGDDFSVRRPLAKLLAKLPDQNVDVPVVGEPLTVADPVHELVAVHHLAGFFHERQQQLVLAGGELTRFALWIENFALVEIEREARKVTRVALAFLALLDVYSADEITGAAQQFARIERLGDVVVRPGLKAEDAVDLVILAGDQDDADIRTGRISRVSVNPSLPGNLMSSKTRMTSVSRTSL
jgi:hypothetical protein